MRRFEYLSPNSRTQAISLLGAAWGGSESLAGGTDLLALMKDDVVTPKRLINIKDINEAYERMLKGDVRYRFVIDMATL